MSRAGLTVGGFYAHFDSKEALIEAALRESSNEMMSVMTKQSRTASRRKMFLDVLSRYLSKEHVEDASHGCALPSVVFAMLFGDTQYAGATAELVEDVSEKLSELFGHDETARKRALGCVALMIGGISLARAFQGTPMSAEILEGSRRLARDIANAAKL